MSGNNQAPIEDGRSPVGGPPRREMATGTKFGIMGLVGVVVLGFIWFNALYSHRAKTQPAVAQTAYGSGGDQYVPAPAVPASHPLSLAGRSKKAQRRRRLWPSRGLT
jgi:type IV secretion system protein VirB10